MLLPIGRFSDFLREVISTNNKAVSPSQYQFHWPSPLCYPVSLLVSGSSSSRLGAHTHVGTTTRVRFESLDAR